MKKNILRIALSICFVFSTFLQISAENPPKREFRGVWFTTVWGNDWPSNPGTSNQSTQKAELLKYINALENLNISTICFQVRGMSDAMYQSSTLPDGLQIPWSQYLSGTNNRGVSPGWDPLEYVVKECHNRGIEVYAWINPFRWANGTSEWSTTYDQAIKSKGWLMSNGTTTVLNPGIPEVRQHITYICKDIISRYGIEGIIFDDYFYPNGGTPETSEAPDYSHWVNSGTTLSFGDWRRQNVDLTIESIYNMIQETRPEVRLVAGPSPLAGASASKYGLTLWPNGYDNQYSILYSDPLSWMDKRIVDMMATQIYWHRDHKLAPFNTITDWWYSLAKHFDLHNCVSMNVYDFETTMSNQADLGKTTAHYDEHVANIKASREYAAKYGVKSTGVNFYDTRHLVSVKSGYDYQEHGEYLRDNCFQRKSINPEIHWKNTPIYNAVSNLAYSSGKLSWTAATIPAGAHELTTIRYTVYAIPTTINYETAITDDGFAGEYLQGITYDPSYTLDSDKQSGYWYAVCVFDGYGNEHAPAIYNYSGGTSAKATLTSPSNGGSAKWEQTFSWSVIDGATYHLQISEFENFSNILIEKTNLTDNSISINLEDLIEGKTYYWKITAQESGKTASNSEIFSFTVSSLTDAPLAQLESPQNNATLSNSAIFSWSNTDEYVTSFTFQIATDANFSNIINSQDMDKAANGAGSTTISINGMETGTYYWRVISKGRIYYDTPSETRTFIVPTLPSIDISLTTPDNGHTLSGATQHFEWSDIENATYLFEIATNEDFSHIIVAENLTTNSYDITVTDLIYSPAYYWRVTAYRTDYKDTTSEVKTFFSGSEYETMGDLTIETLWNKSKNTETFPEELGLDQRSMAAYNGKIYVSQRNSDKSCYLLEFDGKTGDYIRSITLSGDCLKYSTYAANCIFVDGAGHLCVASMGTSSSIPTTVCTVDVSTGSTTSVFTYSNHPASVRFDYVNALGDVTATGGQIWGAVSSAGANNKNYIYRWTRKSDGSWTTEYTIANKFYPTTVTTPGIGGGPWVMPISSTQFLVDGNTNYPTLYTFVAGGNATYKSGFDSNTNIAPVNPEAVGLGQITLGKYSLFIYSSENSSGSGYSFNIANNPSSFDFSKMEKFWTVPKDYLGDLNNAYVLNQVATIKNDDNSATVYVYAPNNGLAAYRIYLPDMPITLTSPINNIQAEQGFDFSWNGVEGSTYTIEISTSETFDVIAFSASTESTTYQSSNFSLSNSTQYYWRVKAANDNYTTTTSAVGKFISPEKPTMTPPQLFKPYNWTTHSSDISFVAKKSYLLVDGVKTYTTKSTLEISKTADFSELYYSGSSNWKEESSEASGNEIWLQYTLPISYFANGTYYWRVRAKSVDPNLEDGISEVRQFKVEGQSEAPGNAETGYSLKHEDQYEYDLKSSGSNYYTFTNLWIRNSEKSNITWWNSTTSTNYRGFCTRHDHNGDQEGKDIIWIARHDGSAAGYLEKYNAANGEYLGTLSLTGDYLKSTYPCNDVFVDAGGNLCIMNLKGTGNNLEIATIDLSTIDNDAQTVKVTPRITLSLSNVRIDHANVIGDITSGEAYIFGSDNATNVYRWELSNGTLVGSYKSNTITSFYPSKYVTSTGTATRIYPVNKDYFCVDGAGSAFTLYKFNESGTNATLSSSFVAYDGSDTAPTGNFGNGGTFFTHDGVPFIVYNSSSFSSNNPTTDDINYKFNLARVSELTSWGAISKYWTIPNDDIGKVANAGKDFGMLADYLQYDAVTGIAKSGNIQTYSSGYDRTNVYIYVPGNGMAAYSLTRHIYTGAEGINAQNIKIGVNTQEITFGCDVDNAQIYTLSGMLINSIDDASSIEKPDAKGVYIIQLTVNGKTTTHKIII